jgi:hypothetical protein
MKNIVIWILGLLIVIDLQAQLYDAQWVIGPVASVLDFRNDTITTRLVQNNVWFFFDIGLYK